MIYLFLKFLPYILVLYFVYRALKDPIFILGIPFLMFLRSSIFFESVELFRIPFRSFQSIDRNPDITLLVWMIIFWIIFRIRSEDFPTLNNIKHYNKFSIIDYIVAGLIIISLIGFGIVIHEYYVLNDVYDKIIVLLALFIGFFIIKDVTGRVEINVLKKFLYNIVLVNSLASCFYFIHQGLHINLYASTNNEYLVTVFEGQVITRTFWFMPVLWFFSISYLLAMTRNKTILDYLLISINIIGIYISYTRSFLMIAILLFIAYYFLIGFKEKSLGKTLKNLFLACIAAIGIFAVVSNFLPASTNYFLSRFEELDDQPATAQNNNLVYRFYKIDRVIARMSTDKKLFGYGSVTEKQTPFVKVVDGATADMGWAEVVFRWGFLGLALFILLYVSSLIKAFFLFIRTEGIVSQLALMLLLTIISQVIEGFTSFTIMSPSRFALALWYFGILSALIMAYGKKKKESQENLAPEG